MDGYCTQNRETADHGPFNAWDRIGFDPRKGPSHRDVLSHNLIWCNYNSANAFDTDDTSTYFRMANNVQMEGWFLKSGEKRYTQLIALSFPDNDFSTAKQTLAHNIIHRHIDK